MRWSCDRTGFPYLHLEGLAVAVLPVTKVGFERFLADPAGPGEDWYAELLAANPRTSWRTPNGRDEGLFLTGVTPDETQTFLRWLGPTYRLPTAVEWRSMDASIGSEPLDDVWTAMSESRVVCLPARTLIGAHVNARRRMRLDGGVMEWVTTFRHKHGGFGRPRPEFFHVLLNPRIHEPVQPIGAGRHAAFGFRAVRPI